MEAFYVIATHHICTGRIRIEDTTMIPSPPKNKETEMGEGFSCLFQAVFMPTFNRHAVFAYVEVKRIPQLVLYHSNICMV